MKKLQPGVYDDGRGALHLDLPELLRAYGYADTPANRDTMIAACRELFDGPVVVVSDDAPRFTCTRCGRTSFNRHDVEQRYCGACHRFDDEQ